MPGEEVSSTLLVEVAGRPLHEEVAACLVSGYVDDSLNVPDLFVLRFSDDAGKILEKAAVEIGSAVRLLVQSSGPGGPVPLISGEVTALETELGSDGVHTVVRGLDMSHRLYRGRRVEAYIQMSATDIARKVAQRAGLTVGKLDHHGPVLPHVSQDGVSDWELLRRLADESGAEVAVVDGALDFRSPTAAATGPETSASSRSDPLVLERGVNLVALNATVTSADQVSEVEVRGWDADAKRELVAVAPAATRSAKLNGTDPASLGKKFGSPRHVVSFSPYNDQGRCDAAAKAIAEQLAGTFAEIEGIARGNPRLRAGTAVALVNVGKPFEGKYTLSSTRHEFGSHSGYRTSFAVSNRSERSLYGVAAGALGASPALAGVISATVTDIKDPDKRGRVKVSFPVMSGDYVSNWARTVQAGAGANRGAVILPEVGDEVLVAFGQGSFQLPYVIGGLFNGKDTPSKPWADHVGANDGRVQRRAFVSRTGLSMEMLESPDGEQIVLSTNGGAQKIALVQKKESAIEIVAEGPVTVTAKKDATVTSTTGDVKVSGKRITVAATSDLELSGANVKVTAKASAEVQGVSVKVAGSASAELSGGATTTVKGGLVRIN